MVIAMYKYITHLCCLVTGESADMLDRTVDNLYLELD